MARILVADDQEKVRAVFRKILEKEGHEVVEAENGKVALRHFHEQPCDLVIADLFMPEMDGLELIQELRTDSPSTKIIAVSGSIYERRPRFLEIAERMEVLTLAKPFSTEDVVDVVNQALG